jgi:hypothetical protein
MFYISFLLLIWPYIKDGVIVRAYNLNKQQIKRKAHKTFYENLKEKSILEA